MEPILHTHRGLSGRGKASGGRRQRLVNALHSSAGEQAERRQPIPAATKHGGASHAARLVEAAAAAAHLASSAAKKADWHCGGAPAASARTEALLPWAAQSRWREQVVAGE